MAGDFAPGNYAIKFVAGNRYRRTLAFQQGAAATPLDLTGVTASLQVRGAGALLLAATSANGMVTLGGAAGTAAIDLPATATALPPGLYAYDLLLTFPGNDPETYLGGMCQVIDSVNGSGP